jgi:hypothetical protein
MEKIVSNYDYDFFFSNKLVLEGGALFHLGALGDRLPRLMVEPALLLCQS